MAGVVALHLVVDDAHRPQPAVLAELPALPLLHEGLAPEKGKENRIAVNPEEVVEILFHLA
ncbi:MAG: hypothetical protein BWY88_00523 [Synergistetes bacterium ADurb.Bin520]|nr:MAG: hypothetical protein BWY88_00523 [Synergistetes bacterium ADurb.Bin520]